jgi:putative ABC transport system ATP-binding protein
MGRELVCEARDLRRRYGAGPGVRAALDGVSLTVARGELVAVLGPSGSGKSTLLGILGGLDRGFEGELRLFGRDARAMSDAELAALRGRRIGFVFQAFHLLGHLTALENVVLPTLFAREPQDGAARRRGTERAEALLAELGLGGRGAERPSQMSGGERQRLAIARALVMDPDLVLCDEPTGNLDLETGRQIVEIFGRLHRERGMTIVAVTHEAELAGAAERIVLLRDGRAVSDERGPGAPEARGCEAAADAGEAEAVG